MEMAAGLPCLAGRTSRMMSGAAPELCRPSMTLGPSRDGRESTLSSFSALQAASPASWPSRGTYSCHFACPKTRRLAADHSEASQPLGRPPSSFRTGKVAGIGARRDLGAAGAAPQCFMRTNHRSLARPAGARDSTMATTDPGAFFPACVRTE